MKERGGVGQGREDAGGPRDQVGLEEERGPSDSAARERDPRKGETRMAAGSRGRGAGKGRVNG